MQLIRLPFWPHAVALLLFALSFSWAAAPLYARDDQFSRLTGSALFKRMKESGDWEITVLPEAIEYLCLTCGGPVVARLERAVPYDPSDFGSVSERYLAERKQFCATLVAARDGRCASHREIGWSMDLHGFRFEYELGHEEVTEMVFFYLEHDVGLVKLVTVIRGEKGARLPETPLKAHMARMTPFFLRSLASHRFSHQFSLTEQAVSLI
ncbi:hypothetical protein [Pseudophaeobacter sp.]|uniref:hypothetical protein n=1 Tax=Pseudophaeobacter sp. TaxID=1971739 RepID=UPI00329A4560